MGRPTPQWGCLEGVDVDGVPEMLLLAINDQLRLVNRDDRSPGAVGLKERREWMIPLPHR